MHGLVGLDVHQMWYVHGADLANDSEVVAEQVGDHQILRAALLIGTKVLTDARVLRGRGAARACALDRLGLDPAVAADAEEALRR